MDRRRIVRRRAAPEGVTAPLLPKLDGGGRASRSVFMPTYNRSRLLRESAAMVLGQTLREPRVIIMTMVHGRRRARRVNHGEGPRVRYRPSGTERGDQRGAQRGILCSRGEFIQICHDHDIYRRRSPRDWPTSWCGAPPRRLFHPGRQGATASARRGWRPISYAAIPR